MIVGCKPEYFNILGSTQTFIGVLLTLNVLCIFLDKSNNFIFSLLEDQNERFVKRLIQCQNKIQIEIDAFKNSNDYKDFQRILNSISRLSSEVRAKIQLIVYNVSIDILTYKTDITENYTPLKEIQKYREQVLAPVFSLGFGLIIFVLDEVARFIPSDFHPFVMAIYVLLFVSILYWTVVWCVFLWHSSHLQESESHKKHIIHRWNDKLGVTWGAIVKYIISGLMYWALLKLPIWPLLNQFCLISLSIIAMVVPIALFGGVRMWACRVKGEYSYVHVLGHLFAMVVYAAMIAIIFRVVKPVDYSAIPFLVSTKWLSFLISIFLLVNGILLPFLLPYFRCTRIYSSKNKEIKKSHQKIKKEIEKFSAKYNDVCRDITREILPDSK